MNMRGFALLEVLVALAIVGGAIVALLTRMQGIAKTAEFIDTKTTAYWVADNRMQKIKAERRIRNRSPLRKDTGEVELDGNTWYWRYELVEVPLGPDLAPAKMFRIDVDVGLQADQKLATLQGYMRE